ncbi:hypothetical protein D9M72_303300 [compost metagenome]
MGGEAQALDLGHWAQAAVQLREHVLHIERFEPELHAPGLDLGQVEHIVDQLQQVAAGTVDDVGVAGLLLAEVAGHVLPQLVAEDQDAVQRRAQLVGHVGEELGLVTVGQHQLLGLVTQLLLGGLALADVDDHRLDHQFAARADRRQAHFQRNQVAIAVLAEQLAIVPHAPLLGLLLEAVAQGHMGLAQGLGQEHFHRGAEHFRSVVTEELLGLAVDHGDPPTTVHQDNGVGRGFHHQAETLLGALACLQVHQVEQVARVSAVIDGAQAEGHGDTLAVILQQLRFHQFSGRLPGQLLRQVQQPRQEATQVLPHEVFRGTAEKFPGTGVGHLDATIFEAGQGRYRQVLQQQAETLFALGQFAGGRLAEQQLTLTLVEVAAHQQRQQHRGGQAGPQAEGDAIVTEHRLVLGRTAHAQRPDTAEQLQFQGPLETWLSGSILVIEHGHVGAAHVLEVDAVEIALGTQDAVHQIIQAKGADDHADQRRAPLFLGAAGRVRAIYRHVEQQPVLRLLVGFLPKLERPGEAGLAALPGAFDGVPAYRLAQHVEAQGAAIAPVQGAAVLHHQILFPRLRGKHTELPPALVPDLADELVEFLVPEVARPSQRLYPRVAFLQLQLVGGPRPLLGRHGGTADHQAGHAAQHHLVGAHPVVDSLGDILRLDLETLLVLGAVARLQRQPLPEYQPPGNQHQGERHQQGQQVHAESGDLRFVHALS